MNTADLRSLADRAEGVQGRPSARLDEVHGRIRVARARRRSAAAAGVVALAMLVAGTALVFRPGADTPSPAPDPTPSPTVTVTDPNPPPEDDGVLDRPLTYAVGQTIHYGDKVFDTGRNLAQVDITDVGVVYLTQDGELWFTDGSSKRQIDSGPGSYHEVYEPVTAALGSRIAYMRSDGFQPLSLVVYDVASDEVLMEAPAGRSVWPRFDETQPEALVYLMTADQVVVYYSDDSRASGLVRLISYDIATGKRTELAWEEMDAIQVSTTARTLGYRVRGDGIPVMRETYSYNFRSGHLLIETYDGVSPEALVADPTDPVTGERLRIKAPAGLPAGDLRLFQWLDDGVFALVQSFGPRRPDDGAIAVCTLSDLSCEVAVEGPQRRILPGNEFYE